jgi:hypothetical protein
MTAICTVRLRELLLRRESAIIPNVRDAGGRLKARKTAMTSGERCKLFSGYISIYFGILRAMTAPDLMKINST